MLSAVAFLPCSIIILINLLTTLLLYFGSGNISLFSATLLLGIIYSIDLRLLGFRRSVLGSSTPSVIHSRGIKSASYNMIANTRQVLYPSASYHNDRVLLKVMPYAGDI